VIPLMKKQQSGRIINIVSRAWLGNFGQSNYSSSKGGLVSLTRVLALELARYNITVNAVAPGLIDTPLTRNLPPETYDKLVAAQPGKRAGKPEDIAHAVAFLASDEAGFISGQVLHVDGGKSIGSTVF
jgi:NAD(P)-dependent dehydrogenase (short-subunit alcohol dehydrogenase family)